jgi:RES domain-containing protein
LIVNAVKIHAYRVLSPQWAYQPHSGAGAVKAGGRFNRPGQQAVYLSLEPETAIAEYAQADPVFGPGTIATYELFLALVVDFSQGYSDKWDLLWQDWDCDWKRLYFRQRG